MVRKIYRKLTKDQIDRGVVFSSTLSPYPTDDLMGLTTHEVTMQDFKDDRLEAEEEIRRLKDDSFFNRSHFKYNIIRT